MSNLRGWWARVRGWAHRVNHPEWTPPGGIEFADEPVRSAILEHAWRRAYPLRVCLDEDVIEHEQAFNDLRIWRLPRPHIGALISRGFLRECYRATDGTIGITRESYEQELEWRAHATPLRLLRRWTKGFLQALAEGLPFGIGS